jgi:hypothetical protein
MVFDTQFDDAEVLLEIEFEYTQWILNIGLRSSDGHERKYHIALLDVVFDPFPVDGNVSFNIMEPARRLDM